MSENIVIGAIFVAAFLVLWWTTNRIGKRDRRKQSSAMEQENAELRHVVTEMSMEKHRSRNESRRGH